MEMREFKYTSDGYVIFEIIWRMEGNIIIETFVFNFTLEYIHFDWIQ